MECSYSWILTSTIRSIGSASAADNPHNKLQTFILSSHPVM